MSIARISIPLIVSRVGEMVASLLYFSFIGHFIVDSLSDASLAWALVSFFTVVGIGFFSVLLINVAGSTDLNSNDVDLNLNISFRCAIVFGGVVVFGVFLYVVSLSGGMAFNDSSLGLEVLLIFSLSIPAIYTQIVIFNFFNAMKKTRYELLYTWAFNLFVILLGGILVLIGLDSNVILFVSAYVVLKWLFVAVAFSFFDKNIQHYISTFRYLQSIPKKVYTTYFFSGVPLALCFGGESLLFFILSFVSKGLGEASLSAYHASLHFLSVIYMISIGVGNATGIVAARYYERKNFSLLRQAYSQGLKFGISILIPLLIACFFLKENISIIYTSNEVVRKSIESNITISLPFLIFEYVYIVTRMTLRSMGDFWMPTIFTILSLNIFGLTISICLLLLYEYSVSSIFIALVCCSFILMLILLWRLGVILRRHDSRPLAADSFG